MLNQAALDFAKRPATTIIKQHAVGRTAIDIETAFEVVRIAQDANGNITLKGWRKVPGTVDAARRTHELISGVWSPTGGWLITLATVSKAVYSGLKHALPKGA